MSLYRVIKLICTINLTFEDVYDSIPTVVTTFVAIMAKISIFILLLDIVNYTWKSLFSLNYTWINSLLLSSILSLLVGSILGLTQFRIKRLYAYSTISHVGFILLSLSVCSVESIQGFLFYLIQYSLSNLNAFIILLTIGYSLFFYTNDKDKFLTEKNNSPVLGGSVGNSLYGCHDQTTGTP